MCGSLMMMKGRIKSFVMLDGWLRGNVITVVGDTELDDESLELARRARMGRHPQPGPMFHFGTCRSDAHEDVTEESPDSYFWGSHKRKLGQYHQEYLYWVTERFEVDPRSTFMSEASGLILESKSVLEARTRPCRIPSKPRARREWKPTETCLPV